MPIAVCGNKIHSIFRPTWCGGFEVPWSKLSWTTVPILGILVSTPLNKVVAFSQVLTYSSLKEQDADLVSRTFPNVIMGQAPSDIVGPDRLGCVWKRHMRVRATGLTRNSALEMKYGHCSQEQRICFSLNLIAGLIPSFPTLEFRRHWCLSIDCGSNRLIPTFVICLHNPPVPKYRGRYQGSDLDREAQSEATLLAGLPSRVPLSACESPDTVPLISEESPSFWMD